MAEWIQKQREFLKEYIELCEKYNLMFESDDPYCGIIIYPLNEGHIKEMQDDFDNVIERTYRLESVVKKLNSVYNKEYENHRRYNI